MGLGVVLSLIFLVLKLMHYINWLWFWVLFPTGIEITIVVLYAIGGALYAVKKGREN